MPPQPPSPSQAGACPQPAARTVVTGAPPQPPPPPAVYADLLTQARGPARREAGAPPRGLSSPGEEECDASNRSAQSA